MIHKSDAGKSSNTGRLLPLVLTHARLFLHGIKDSYPHDITTLSQGLRPIILFPGRHAKPLSPTLLEELKRHSESQSLTVIVPDGNWNQAKHMMNRIPALSQTPAFELTDEVLVSRTMRRNIHPGRLSTFEATARILGLLDGPQVEEELLYFYERFVDRMLMMRGKIKAQDFREHSQ